MENVILPIDFLAGTSVDEAIKEAIQLSKLLRLNLSFRFNGVYMFIKPNSIFDEEIKTWELGVKIAQAK